MLASAQYTFLLHKQAYFFVRIRQFSMLPEYQVQESMDQNHVISNHIKSLELETKSSPKLIRWIYQRDGLVPRKHTEPIAHKTKQSIDSMQHLLMPCTEGILQAKSQFLKDTQRRPSTQQTHAYVQMHPKMESVKINARQCIKTYADTLLNRGIQSINKHKMRLQHTSL